MVPCPPPKRCLCTPVRRLPVHCSNTGARWLHLGDSAVPQDSFESVSPSILECSLDVDTVVRRCPPWGSFWVQMFQLSLMCQYEDSLFLFERAPLVCSRRNLHTRVPHLWLAGIGIPLRELPSVARRAVNTNWSSVLGYIEAAGLRLHRPGNIDINTTSICCRKIRNTTKQDFNIVLYNRLKPDHTVWLNISVTFEFEVISSITIVVYNYSLGG